MDQARKQLLITLATFGLALGFLASGSLKLVHADIEVEAFHAFGIPLWLMTVIGVGEIGASVVTTPSRPACLMTWCRPS